MIFWNVFFCTLVNIYELKLWRNLLRSSIEEQHLLQQFLFISTKLYGIRLQKIVILLFTAVRAQNLYILIEIMFLYV
jgi:hypothetical protein